ncbi:MAG TPA: hypothetical protein VLA74_12780 [Nitrososphaeraceae archaeon]|nr:hypothetical protein [Nitrososphaeraceae archaeon]
MVTYTLLVILTLLDTHFNQKTYGQSTSFIRQEILDPIGDWELWKGFSPFVEISTHDNFMIPIPIAKNKSECMTDSNKFYSPDIESVSYVSDGKKLNASLWLATPLYESPINDTLDKFQESLKLDIQNEKNLSLDNFTFIRTIELDLSNEEVSDATLGGMPAKYIKYNPEGDPDKIMTEIWTVANANKKIYHFKFLALSSTFDIYNDTVNEILNSFHIIDNDLNNKSAIYNIAKDKFLNYTNNEFSITYPPDWNLTPNTRYSSNNSSEFILQSPFEDTKYDEPPWHETFFTLAIDLNSVHDAGTDYRIVNLRIPHDGKWNGGNWTQQIREISAYDKNNLLKENEYKWFKDKKKIGSEIDLVPFSVNLTDLNFPKDYKFLLYITDNFVINHKFCRMVDTSNWVMVPPPDFSITAQPSSVSLRPGEKSAISLEINGNSALQSEAKLTVHSNNPGISAYFIPNTTNIPSLSSGNSILNVNVKEDIKNDTPSPVVLQVIANISFPNSITNRGGETFSNTMSVSVPTSSNLTLTILPKLTWQQNLSNFTNDIISPLSGLWTFLAGIGAVIVPLILRVYNKRKKEKNIIDKNNLEKSSPF